MKYKVLSITAAFCCTVSTLWGQATPAPIAQFDFEKNTTNDASNEDINGFSFSKGLDGFALRIASKTIQQMLPLDIPATTFSAKRDFTVQFWLRTTMDAKKIAVILSQKDFPDNSLASQKKPGWVLYSCGGTWAWNMGTGRRRITHERDNGKFMPLNDGKWHQITMTYDSKRTEIRLFYDGDNKATYHVSDGVGFDFSSLSQLVVGSGGTSEDAVFVLKAEFNKGAEKLQELVDEFNGLGFSPLASAELSTLITDPKILYKEKINKLPVSPASDDIKLAAANKVADFKQINKLRTDLMKNPYTVHQISEFMEVAPLLKLYSLVDGKIKINEESAKSFIEEVKISPSDFDMDKLSIWGSVLSAESIMESYTRYFKSKVAVGKQELKQLIVADWNIWHGGKHFSKQKDGWDSRERIAEILKKENADVIMMQETYSSGDFISAELGYYFAATVDWDYLNQGSNISVLSRYPIKEAFVPATSPFMNVTAKVALSKTQDIYVMSNWYGMDDFPKVYDFHEKRFAGSDTIPVLFGGDFNAVPHTDGGTSPASLKMLGSGFKDAFRSLYPDLIKYPGYSHRDGERIDQIYYKGKGLTNVETKIVNSWAAGFPSDHFLLISKFKLNYSSR